MGTWFQDNGFSDLASQMARGENVGAVRQPLNTTALPGNTGLYADYGMAGSNVPSVTTGAPDGGGDLRSQVVALANQVGRSDIAANPDYWVQQIAGKGQGPGGANGPLDTGYWSDRFKTANQGDSGGASPGAASGLSGAFLQPYGGQFQAPQGTDDPGFQFAVQQGQDAIQRSAAAKGTLLTGGTLKDLASYTTGAALQDYSGAYNRALQTFGTNYDVFRNNQTDPYNKLMGATNLGLSATGAANQAGSSYLNNLTGNANNFQNVSGNQTISQGNIGAQNALNQGSNLSSALGSLPPNWYTHLASQRTPAPTQPYQWQGPINPYPQGTGLGSDNWA